MIKAPKLTATGDLDLSEPGGSWGVGIAVIADRVRYELNIRRGEWYYDSDGGFDLFGIGQDRYSKARLDAEVRRCLNRVPGVLAVRSVTSTFNTSTRRLDFVADVATSEGAQTITVATAPDQGFLVPSFAAAMFYQSSIIR